MDISILRVKGKCEPILQHMLKGLEVRRNPLLNPVHEEEKN